jgi:hypothetical protein
MVTITGAGYGASVALGEEKQPKVLTVEKAGGEEAVVGDTVAAKLQKEIKVEFLTSAGEITCGKSEIKGTVKTNPEKTTGNATINIETWIVGECATNIAGVALKGATPVAIEDLPLVAETEGESTLKIPIIAGGGLGEVEVAFTLENAAKEEQVCVYRSGLKATFRNGNEGEIEIDQTLSGFFDKKNCGRCPLPLPTPTWKAKYRPLKDETGARAGKQIFIN